MLRLLYELCENRGDVSNACNCLPNGNTKLKCSSLSDVTSSQSFFDNLVSCFCFFFPSFHFICLIFFALFSQLFLAFFSYSSLSFFLLLLSIGIFFYCYISRIFNRFFQVFQVLSRKQS